MRVLAEGWLTPEGAWPWACEGGGWPRKATPQRTRARNAVPQSTTGDVFFHQDGIAIVSLIQDERAWGSSSLILHHRRGRQFAGRDQFLPLRDGALAVRRG